MASSSDFQSLAAKHKASRGLAVVQCGSQHISASQPISVLVRPWQGLPCVSGDGPTVGRVGAVGSCFPLVCGNPQAGGELGLSGPRESWREGQTVGGEGS